MSNICVKPLYSELSKKETSRIQLLLFPANFLTCKYDLMKTVNCSSCLSVALYSLLATFAVLIPPMACSRRWVRTSVYGSLNKYGKYFVNLFGFYKWSLKYSILKKRRFFFLSLFGTDILYWLDPSITITTNKTFVTCKCV